VNENKLNFIYSLIEYLISDGQFSPIQSENQELHFDGSVNYLAKDFQGSPIIIGLIDADSISENQLSEILEKDTGILNNINARNAYIFEVLLFNESLSDQMLSIIEQGQADFPDEKKFLKCFSINVTEKQTQKHFSVPNYDAGIEKYVRRFFSKGLDQRQCTAQDVADSLAKRKKDFEFTFAADKPFVTYALIAINILVFALISLISTKSGKSYSEYLAPFGAKVNTLILQGEYWRFITPMFLHNDIVHVGVNCYSLYIVGSLIERLFGHVKFTFVYFVSGILGCIASFAFSLNPSVGASGAIFGIFGAMLFFGIRRPALMKSSFGINLITTIIINLVTVL
jgi:rhomboid protease GluP